MSEQPGTRPTEPLPESGGRGEPGPPATSGMLTPDPGGGRHAWDERGPATRPLSEPESASEPAPESTPEPTPEPTTKPTTKPGAEAAAKPDAKPATKGEPPKSVLEPPEAGPPPKKSLQGSWQFWVVMAAAAVLLLILAWFFVTAFLPRWWSQRIAGIGEGHPEPSIAAGLAIGAVFTVLALAALGFSVARGRSWRGRLLILVGALVLASPNLTTLGIVWGPGGDARAGEDRLRVFAPGFLGGSLAGAVTGAIVMVIVWILYDRYRRRGVEIARLRAELERRPARAADDD